MLADELLTQEEWDEIKDFPKPAMHIYQWIGDVIATCHERGFIRSDMILAQMNDHLECMREKGGLIGGPSLPYVYTLFVTVLVKLYLFLFCFYQAGFIWKVRTLKEMPGWSELQSESSMQLIGVWQSFIVSVIP